MRYSKPALLLVLLFDSLFGYPAVLEAVLPSHYDVSQSQQPTSSANLVTVHYRRGESAKRSLDRHEATYASGQFIVKFKPSLRQCAHCLWANHRRFATALTDASSSLDQLNVRAQVHGIRNLFVGRHQQDTARAQASERRRIERLKKKFPRRTARTPVGAALPDLTNVYVFEVAPEADVEQLCRLYQADPHVEYAHPNYRVEILVAPNDPYYSSSGSWGQPYDDLWGLKQIQAESAWNTTHGNDVLVAVVDTGLDDTHPDMAINAWTNTDEIPSNGVDDDGNGFVDDVQGWDFANGDNDPMDDHGHGTHVSGTVAAVGNNAVGVVGVAWQARIMGVKGLDAGGSGFTADLAEALSYAANNGAEAINNSWGGRGRASVIEDAITYAHGVGAVVVAAAGNSDESADAFFPANHPLAITVAASDENDQKCFFSNFGAKIDVAAPGCGTNSPPPGTEPFRNILSLASATCNPGMCDPSLLVTPGYLRQAGTSMAAPHVTGVAALVLAAHQTFTNEEVRQALRVGADDAGAPGFDTEFGYGRLNAANAVQVSSVCVAQLTFPTHGALVRSGDVIVTGTATCPAFQQYQLEFAPDVSGPWTLVGPAGTSPVVNGALGTWQVGTASGAYYLRLLVTDQANRSFQDLVGPIWFDQDLHPGWPRFIDGIVSESGPFAMADVDGNGADDLIVGDLAGRLHVFTGSGEELPGWPAAVGTPIISDVVASDVDHDGDRELFFVGGDHSVYGYQSSGVPLSGWPQPIIDVDSGSYAVVLGDVDQDGAPEVIVMSTWPSFLSTYHAHVFRADGFLLRTWPLYDVWNAVVDFNTGPAIADLNGDGNPEFIVPMIDTVDSYYYLYVFDSYGALLKRLRLDGITARISRGLWGIEIGFLFNASRPVVGDLDRDGDLELVISRSYLNAVGYDVGKLFVWSYDNGSYIALASGEMNVGHPGQVALADFDADGDLEVLCGANYLDADGFIHVLVYLYVFQHNGTLLLQSFDPGWLSYIYASPAVGDVDGDGILDALLTDVTASAFKETMSLYHFFSQEGFLNAVHEVPIAVQWFNYAPPMIGDLDGNGDTEVVAIQPETGLIAAYDAGGSYDPARIQWPQFQHDAEHSGFYSQVPPPNINQPPVLNPIGNKTVAEGQLLTFGVSATDLDGNPLTYQATNLPTGASFQNQTFSWTPGFNQAGTYSVTFTVSDGAAQDAETILISVTNVALQISKLSDSPDPFSPNGDGRKETTKFSGKFNHFASWQLDVRDPSGVVVRSFSGAGTLFELVWNGTTGSGVPVADAKYTYTLSGTDIGGSSKLKSASVTLDTLAPTLSAVGDAPDPFRPSTGQTTSITFTISETSTVTLKIYNSGGSTVRTLLNSASKVAGTTNVVWDGKNSSGLFVPVGVYTYKLFVQDKAGNRASSYPAVGTITVQ